MVKIPLEHVDFNCLECVRIRDFLETLDTQEKSLQSNLDISEIKQSYVRTNDILQNTVVETLSDYIYLLMHTLAVLI